MRDDDSSGREPPLRASTLVAFFSSSLGEEKAREIVHAALKRFGVLPSDLAEIDRSKAIEILESLVGEPGIVGVTARFAKARILLRRS